MSSVSNRKPRRAVRATHIVDQGTQSISDVEVKTLAITLLPAAKNAGEIKPTALDDYVVQTKLLEMDANQHFVIPFGLRNILYSNFSGLENLFEGRSLEIDETQAKEGSSERKMLERSLAVPLFQAAERMTIILAIRNSAERNQNTRFQEADSSEEDVPGIVFDLFKELSFILDQMETKSSEILLKFQDPEDKKVTFEEAIFLLNKPGLIVTTTDADTVVAYETISAQLKRSFMGSYIQARGFVLIDNGNGPQKVADQFILDAFNGEVAVSELDFGLITADSTKGKELAERGRKYVQLTSNPSYVKCEGHQKRRSWSRTNQFRAKGRCMIDIVSMRQMDPDYSYYFGVDRYSDEDKGRKKVPVVLSDADFIIASPFVYGFSFLTKQWGEFKVQEMSNISFRDTAFDNLVLDPAKKEILYSLVDTVRSGTADLIDGKSIGTILLLAGPSGAGKTLTAESIAERLQRPLYMVGVGELGTDAESLERNLSRVLSTATAWNAILLIDEADIFMEERSAMDVERNAMVGIFLRLLEYYEGVLFLTTNRANNIDKAFFSRISLSLYYEALGVRDRRTVWKNLAGMNDIRLNSNELDQLSAYDLNGREIKNVLKLASALAGRDDQPVRISYMIKVIDQGINFKDKVNVKKTFGGFINGLFSRFQSLIVK